MVRNGQLDVSTLGRTVTGHRLRTDAAAAFNRLAVAFERDVGYRLAITDAYRSLAEQIIVKALKGILAARPGTSEHGWGLALDLASNVPDESSWAHKWMDLHAHEYGWVNPPWARDHDPRNGAHEPWHWEYVPALDQHDGIGDYVAPRPVAPTPEEDDDMKTIATDGKSPQVWIGDGVTRRKIVTQDTLKSVQWLASNGYLNVAANGAVQTVPDLWALGHPIDA